MKKLIARILVLTMLVAMTSGMALAANFDDMPSDWSTAALEAAVNNGLLKGNNGKIMPKAFLTRAQMAAIVGRAFGATEKASLTAFADVSTSKWYYDDLAKAVQMKVLQGDGNRLKPDSNITREEAFVVLARAFKLSGAKDDMLNHFSDKDKVSSWAKDGVAVLVAAGYVSGANGKLNPKQNITRAEFAQIMHNLLSVYVTEAGNFSHDVAGNVMVNTPNAVLKNMTITGNLIIGDGVGDGDVTLENVKVTGTTLVRGGGVNSIRIMGNTSMQNIVIARVNGEVRVFAENGTQVGTVIADGNDDVIIEGKVGSVVVEADGVTVTAKNATIASATVSGEGSKIIAGGSTAITAVVVNAANSEIVTEKGVTIGKIEINEDGAKVSGAGTVGTVAANANDVVVTTPGTSVTAGAGTTGVVAGTTPVTGGGTVTTPGAATGGGSYVPPAPNPTISATFEATGRIMIAPEEDGDMAGTMHVEYKLVADGKDISLAEDNVKAIRVKLGNSNWFAQTVKKYATIWHNVDSAMTMLTYEVETKDGKKYQATFNWETEVKAAAWAATGVKGPHEGKNYVEYELRQNGTQISLAADDVKLIAQKVDGKWTKLEANTDETLWFNEAKDTGNYDFFVVTSEGAMYKATLNWEKPDTTEVKTLAELENALATEYIKTININEDITNIAATIKVERAVTINGNGKTLSFQSLAGKPDGDRNGLLVMENKVKIENLKIVMADGTNKKDGETTDKWDGVYGIQVYGVTGVVITDYTGSGGDAALLVNGAKVTLEGAIDVSGNQFGGIEVSKGADLANNGALAVEGIIVNTGESPTNPSVWVVNGQGAVTGDILMNSEVKEAQTYYYTPDVADANGLKAALMNEFKKVVNINADIAGIAATIKVERAVTINGNGKTLSFQSLAGKPDGERNGLLVMADGVIIKDICICMEEVTGWKGIYGVQVYNVKNVVFDGYTGTGGDAVLLVNGAEVTLTGTINVSGNEFGGIEVSKGTLATVDPKLTISDTAAFINTTEAYGLPTIWEDVVTGTVVDAANFTPSNSIKTGQVQYYLVADNAKISTLLNSAAAYKYADGYTYTGESVIDGTIITYTAPTAAFAIASGDANTRATMDLARLLGALYRVNDGKNVASITYDATVYTWDKDGIFEGSNWMNGDKTLVSAIVSYIGENAAKLTTDGVTFDLLINSTKVTFTVKALNV